MPKSICEQCGSEYTPRQHNQRFCTSVCSAAWHAEQRRIALEIVRAERGNRPLTYAEIAGNTHADALAPADLPAPAWSHDPVPTEPPLGIDIETVPPEARQ